MYYNGLWQTICGNIGSISGDLVCRQLGYSLVSKLTTVYTNTSVSQVSVHCYGEESSLHECRLSQNSSCYLQPAIICSKSSEFVCTDMTVHACMFLSVELYA